MQRVTVIVNDFAAMAGLQHTPRVALLNKADQSEYQVVSDAEPISCFGNGVIAVDRHFAATFPTPALRVALAHEITHIADGSGQQQDLLQRFGKMAVGISATSTFISLLALNPAGLLSGALCFGAVLAAHMVLGRSLSRHGEYVADRGSVLLDKDGNAYISSLTELEKFGKAQGVIDKAPRPPILGQKGLPALFYKAAVALLNSHPSTPRRVAYMHKIATRYRYMQAPSKL